MDGIIPFDQVEDDTDEGVIPFEAVEEDIEEPGWIDTIASGITRGTMNTAKAAAGGIEFLEDTPLLGSLVRGAEDLIGQDQFGERTRKEAEEALKYIEENYKFKPRSIKNYANQASTAITQAAPALAAPGYLAAGATFGAQGFGNDYGNAQQDGQDYLTSVGRGVGGGAVDAITGAISFSRLLKPDLGLKRRMAEAYAANVVGGPIGTLGHAAVETQTGGDGITYDQFIDSSIDNAASNLITAPVLALGGHGYTKYNQTRQAKAIQAEVDATAADMVRGIPSTAYADLPFPGDPNSLQVPDVENLFPPGVTGDRNGSVLLDSDVPELPEPKRGRFNLLPKADAPADNGSIIMPEESYPRSPDQQAELEMLKRDMELKETGLVDVTGKPLSAIPDAPPQPIVRPFTAKGAISKSLGVDEQKLVKELSLSEQSRKAKEAASLPVPVKSSSPARVEDAIQAETFPKVLKYVQEQAPDKATLQAMAKAQTTQGEAKQAELAEKFDVQSRNTKSPEDIAQGKTILQETSDLVADARKKAETKRASDEQTQARSRTRQLLLNLKGNEGGWIRNPFTTKEGINGLLDKDSIPEIERVAKELGPITGTPRQFNHSDIHKYLKNGINNILTFPKTVADKSPEFGKIFDGALQLFRDRDTVAHKMRESLDPYFSLGDKTRVNTYLAAARQAGDKAMVTPEYLASKGLSPEEVAAFQSVRQTMDQALDFVAEGMVAKGMDPEQAASTVQQLKAANYVPFTRYGEYFVTVKNDDGSVAYFSMHPDKAQAAATAAKFGDKATWGKYEPAPKEYDDGIPPGGFGPHLLQAKLTPGYSKNMERNLAEYVVSLSNFVAHNKAKAGFEDALSKIDITTSPELYKYAKNYTDYIQSNSPEAQKFRQVMATMYLGLNAKSAIVNLTQSVTTTLPQLVKHTGSSAIGIYRRSFGKAALSAERLAKSDPELAQAIQSSLEDGTISDKSYREMSGMSRGGQGKVSKFADFSMKPFSAAERFNRRVAFINGFDAARKLGFEGADAQKFAEKFVLDTQFDYSKANRPRIARGSAGASLLTFKLFAGNYIRFLRNIAPSFSELKAGGGKRDLAALSTALAAMGALGGVASFPLAKELIKSLELANVDPKRMLKDALGNGHVADIAVHGFPYKAGFDISGSVGPGEIAPALEGRTGTAADMFAAAGKFALGVPGDMIINRPHNAWTALTDGDSPWRAAESLMPEALRNASVGARAAKEGAFKNMKGVPTLKDPTALEIGSKMIGFTPARLRDAYDKNHSIELFQNSVSDNNNVNQRIGRALAEGDKAGARKILEEIREHNKTASPARRIEPDEQAIILQVLKYKNPDAYQLMQTKKAARPELAKMLRDR